MALLYETVPGLAKGFVIITGDDALNRMFVEYMDEVDRADFFMRTCTFSSHLSQYESQALNVHALTSTMHIRMLYRVNNAQIFISVNSFPIRGIITIMHIRLRLAPDIIPP
jgi:hypothetical protein